MNSTHNSTSIGTWTLNRRIRCQKFLQPATLASGTPVTLQVARTGGHLRVTIEPSLPVFAAGLAIELIMLGLVLYHW